MRRWLFLTVYFILLCSLTAYAGGLELSPFVGGYFFEHRENLKDKPVYGLRLGYGFTDKMVVEGVFEYINTSVDDKGKLTSERPPFGSPDGSVQNYLYHLDLVYGFLPYDRLNPYVAAGVGVAHFKPSEPDDSTRFSANFGGGLKYWISDHLALRADIRDMMTFADTFHNIDATLGIVIGKRPKKAIAVEAPAPPPPPVEEKPAPPAPAPPAPPPPVPKPELSFETVHFDFDKADVTDPMKPSLDKDIAQLKDNPDIRLIIVGHACAHGPEEYNMGLSKRRADNVRDYFTANGIAPERLMVEYYGETRLAMPEIPTPDNKYSPEAVANRRVEFRIENN
jgi:OOP family OmpA-OmpF porin